mmetsp:Transcript_24946/g.63265  ORF Transcript_24946/g.63265 Transcript_24946/m.63265 type:complete len:206 (-) Transcript_24946:285-902(-)
MAAGVDRDLADAGEAGVAVTSESMASPLRFRAWLAEPRSAGAARLFFAPPAAGSPPSPLALELELELERQRGGRRARGRRREEEPRGPGRPRLGQPGPEPERRGHGLGGDCYAGLSGVGEVSIDSRGHRGRRLRRPAAQRRRLPQRPGAAHAGLGAGDLELRDGLRQPGVVLRRWPGAVAKPLRPLRRRQGARHGQGQGAFVDVL